MPESCLVRSANRRDAGGWDAGRMTGDRDGPEPVISRLGEDDWRAWRQVRLAALADAPESFAGTVARAAALTEPDWRAMTREGAIFLAIAAGQAIGAAAGLPRESPAERGLGAVWVAPPWRGRGVAALLAGAVIGWARSQGCARVGLWVPTDNARALAFYRRQGFRPNGRTLPFPDAAHRSICEMWLDLAEPQSPGLAGPRPGDGGTGPQATGGFRGVAPPG
jgi:GNAT superfamily N-acetyltransferase